MVPVDTMIKAITKVKISRRVIIILALLKGRIIQTELSKQVNLSLSIDP